MTEMKTKFKNNKIVISLLIAMLIFACAMTGCAKQAPQETPEAEATPNLTVEEIAVEKTTSDLRVLSVPADVEVPEVYTDVKINGIDETVFAFTDETGNTQLRVYGEVDHLEDGEVVDTQAGFFPVAVKPAGEDIAEGVFAVGAEIKKLENAIEDIADETATDEPAEGEDAAPEDVGVGELYIPNYELVVPKNAEPVNTAAEKAGQCVPMTVPAPPEGDDVNSTDDVFVVPENYVPVEGTDGLFSYVNVNGETVYRVYGAFEGQEAGLWMANEDGTMVPGAFMIDTAMESALMQVYNDAAQANAELEEGTETVPVPDMATYIVLFVDGETVEAMLTEAEVGVVVEVPEEEAAESANPDAKATDKPSDNGSNNTGGNAGGGNGGNNGGGGSSSGGGNTGGGSGGGNTGGGDSGGGNAGGGNGGGGNNNPAPTPEKPSGHWESHTYCGVCNPRVEITGNIKDHGAWHAAMGTNFNYYTEEEWVES